MLNRTINIIDPALNSTRGHHFDWNKKLHDLYIARGYTVRVYCNRNVSQDLLNCFDSCFPVFSGYPYRPVVPVSRNGRPKPANVKIAEELYWIMGIQRSFEAELSQVLPADFQLFTTLFDYQLAALSHAQLQGSIRAAIHFPPDQRGSNLGPALWACGFKMAADGSNPPKFLATTPEVAHLYRSGYQQNITQLPHIYDVVRCSPRPKAERRVVGFLGEQRAAKGAALIPDLVSRLVDLGCYVICQDSSERLALNTSSGSVEVLGYVDSLAEVIARCDLVVAPYKPDWYRYNMAGIVMESLCCGVPVVAPAGTSPGNLVASLDAGVTFKTFDVASIVQAVRSGLDSLPHLKDQAVAAQGVFEREHGLVHFAKTFLA